MCRPTVGTTTTTIELSPDHIEDDVGHAWADVPVERLDVPRGGMTHVVGSFGEWDVEVALEL